MGRACKRKHAGSQLVFALGGLVALFLAAPAAIDIPTYFNVQQQLQTATEAAALAGASKLAAGTPQAQQDAMQAAYDIVAMNPVGGKILQPGDLEFIFHGSSLQVKANTQMSTITSKFMCLLDLGKKDSEAQEEEHIKEVVIQDCDALRMSAEARAIPAARDTVLVIDTSNSMDDLGNNRPFKDVKSAANTYLDQVMALNNESVDKVALVDFNTTARIQQPLISQHDTPQFAALRGKIQSLKLYSGTGWNTNYESGLRLALDELEAHGRLNSNKHIIFLTDGNANLPAPPSFHNYNNTHPYNKCTDIVNNSSQVRALCQRDWRGRLVCPVLPNAQITNSMISQSAVNCGLEYTNYMEDKTNFQTMRAKQMGVTITTIVIPSPVDGNSIAVLRRLRKEPNYAPIELARYMSDVTEGQHYEANNYDAARINEIYSEIAKDIRVRLASVLPTP